MVFGTAKHLHPDSNKHLYGSTNILLMAYRSRSLQALGLKRGLGWSEALPDRTQASISERRNFQSVPTLCAGISFLSIHL